MERYCEVVAALKLRTSNRKGHHLSTNEAIRLLEEYGVETPNGHLQAPRDLLKRPTVNRYLKQWGYDRSTLLRPPPAVRFQADHSNDCWHFDLSPSDLKQIKAPEWMQDGPGRPVLMLYSVVDDRSGVAYQEYHGVYGEDVEAALRFLFAAMSPKSEADFPFQGIPQMLYMDNGPIARSQVFQQVMRYLGVEVRTHLPQSQTGRKAAARAKGKVERPFPLRLGSAAAGGAQPAAGSLTPRADRVTARGEKSAFKMLIRRNRFNGTDAMEIFRHHG